MVALEDHIKEVVVLDVLDPPCVYIFICVERNTNTSDGGASQARFFLAYSTSLSVFLTTNPMSL